MPTIKVPPPRKRPTSEYYWIRKKVPVGLRSVVGKTEVWASLGTKDKRKAVIKIGAVNAEILAFGQQVPAEHGKLAGHGHCGDLMAAPGTDAYEESMQRPGRFGCRPRRLHKHSAP